MLKYVETEVTFSEVPDETALCINISNCKQGCKNCHSPWLAEDIGNPLNWENLNALIHINSGITCVAFMGGDSDPAAVNELAKKVHRYGLKTCWYSGKDELSPEIKLWNFDYIKLGPYIESKGPLTKDTTNQKFYEVCKIVLSRDSRGIKDYGYYLEDVTSKFWKKNKDSKEETV